MEQEHSTDTDDGIWFVYDGECQICRYAAHALRIRQSVGELHLVDARSDKDHPLVREINALKFDLDESMVIKYGGSYYRGPDGLQLMALIGSQVGWFNRVNALLFKKRTIARVCYPPMRACRNFLLHLRGVGNIANLGREGERKPIFRDVFGLDWEKLPNALKDHYANRCYSQDAVTVQGRLDVSSSRYMRLLAPLMRLSGALVPFEGEDVPVTVVFRSEPNSSAYCFDRLFHFPNRKPHRFFSRMIAHRAPGEMIEYMRFGFGWRAHYRLENGKVIISHRGYVLKLGKWLVPIPFELLLGRADAEEEALNESSFRMHVTIVHPLFGRIFGYRGTFEVQSVRLYD